MTGQAWKTGDRVRVGMNAFPGSDEPCDRAARGQIGVLIEQIDDDLWMWRGDDGTVTYPKTDELEQADE